MSVFARFMAMALTFAPAFLMPSLKASGAEPFRSVPKASCGTQDRVESVQGQTTLAERYGSASRQPYQCNLELLGQFRGEGSGFGLITYQDCAYYSTWPNAQRVHPGVVVIDIADVRNLKVTEYLSSPAMLDANESMEVDGKRQLLLAFNRTRTVADLYDLSAGCRHPRLIQSVSTPRLLPHVGEFAADGQTFYGASSGEYQCDACADKTNDPNAPPQSAVFAIDMSDVQHPREIATWIPENKEWLTHAVSLNRSGNRAYVALWRLQNDEVKAPHPNGLAILDISDAQARRPDPKFRVISTLFWDDTHFSQLIVPAEIAGREYLIWTDIAGALGVGGPGPNYDPFRKASPEGCKSGKPSYGFARIIDITDERSPRTVSKLQLEVHEPRRCSQVVDDPVSVLGYGSLACAVDDARDAKLLACGYFEAGLRVFDIRNPEQPREVAYYKPPAHPRDTHAGAPIVDKGGTADPVIVPRFRNNGREIWFTSFQNGLQAVRFSDEFVKSHRDLFRN